MTGTLESPYEAAPMGSPFFSAEEQRVFDAKLSEIVAHYPVDRKSAAMLPALRLLQEDAHFRAAVREGIAQADRGEFIDEEVMNARLEQMLRS